MLAHCHCKSILRIAQSQLAGKFFPYNYTSYGIVVVVSTYHGFYLKTCADVTINHSTQMIKHVNCDCGFDN